MTDVRRLAPVSAEDRVSDVLARDEALIEVFVRHAPHFARLRNRALRRVMARLVTVEQAARTAHVPVERLLNDLNAMLGISEATSKSSNAAPSSAPELQRPRMSPEVDVDVRDDLRAGREPFARIMRAVAALDANQVLHLRTIFEPVPLFEVLAKRGFAHESQSHAADDWSVWFWRPTTGEELVLDVRGLSPPEPMLRTLAALETLPAGATLVHVNSRVPRLLFPILVERGFLCDVDESDPERVVVRIRDAAPDSSSPQIRDPMSAPTTELDVRAIAPRDKHPTIFRTFEGLASGQSMVIVNDHDPKPLRYQLAAEHPDQFQWTYEAEGPEVWRVRIDRR